MYRFVDAALVRAAVLPYDLDVGPWPDFTGTTPDHIDQCCAWMRRVWAIKNFTAAVENASPVLAAQVHKVCAGQEQRPRHIHRAAVSIARYLVRATTRATPFGMFSGVAPARFGQSTSVCWRSGHQAVSRVDSKWLEEVLTGLESEPGVRSRLSVVVNSVAFYRDGRLVLSWQPPRTSASTTQPREVSVRHTAVVHAITQAASTPIRYRELAEKVAADFPHASTAEVDRVIGTLVDQGFVLTALRPPMTETDPLAHVLGVLAEVRVDAMPQVRELVGKLRRAQALMAQHSTVPTSQTRARERADLTCTLPDLSSAEHPQLGVDLRLDIDMVVPQSVAREAEVAASVLLRLAPWAARSPGWCHYHGRFLERYGPKAMVPVTELVSDTGLGFPAGYRGSSYRAPEPALSERDAVLLGIAQRAAIDRRLEVDLDEDTISALEVADVNDAAVQPHTELRVRVQADSQDALDRGDFELVISGVSRAVGTTTGRFLDLFSSEVQGRMRTAYAELPTTCETALPVQVSAPALYRRTDNVARTPPVLPLQMPLAEHPLNPPGVGLDDLAVTADTERLYLISLSRQRPVEPTQFSAVELVHHAHPLVRFLTEVSTARSVPCEPFSWGAAGSLPFLPRIRYRRTILSPARWRLTAEEVAGTTAPWADWEERFDSWRHRLQVPGVVYVGDGDRRMSLDLNNSAHLYLLRAELDRAGHVVLREGPKTMAFGWCYGHAHELVVPLASTQPGVSEPQRSSHLADRRDSRFPAGAHWVYLKLYSHPDRHDTILTRHLAELLSTWDTEPEWWFVRYHDPDPHLRLRVRLNDPGEFAAVAAQIGEWTSRLRGRGLLARAQFDTYDRETGRFGPDPAMRAVESVFAADSAGALAQLAAVHDDQVAIPALTAASMVDLVCSFTTDPEVGMRWLIEHARVPSRPAPDRAVRDQALRFAEHPYELNALGVSRHGERIAAAWKRRRVRLQCYRAALVRTGRGAPDAVLTDLLHLHHVRVAGISPDAERMCLHLARAAALSWISRTGGRP